MSSRRKHKLRLLLSARHYECRSHPRGDHCSDLNKTQFKEFAGGFVIVDLTLWLMRRSIDAIVKSFTNSSIKMESVFDMLSNATSVWSRRERRSRSNDNDYFHHLEKHFPDLNEKHCDWFLLVQGHTTRISGWFWWRYQIPNDFQVGSPYLKRKSNYILKKKLIWSSMRISGMWLQYFELKLIKIFITFNLVMRIIKMMSTTRVLFFSVSDEYT